MTRKALPLAPSGAPGIWREVVGMLPTRAGTYYTTNVFGGSQTVAPSSPGTVLRAWTALLPDDTVKCFVGTTTKLYEYDGATTATDRSKVGGYTNTATDWSFAQFGPYTIAANRVDAVQVRDSTGSSAFADLAGSPPKARIVVTQSDQVLLFDINDGAEKGNAFASCAPGDQTDWSGAGATTATPIRHRPGKITAAVAFRDFVVVAKKSSVYKLTYTGSTNKWRVECIATGRGCFGKHDMVVTGDEVLIRGPGGTWRFDGATWRQANEWQRTDGDACSASVFCPKSSNVILFNTVTASGQWSFLAYNMVSDRWSSVAYVDPGTPDGRVLVTGEPAALLAFVVPTDAFPDKLMTVGTAFATSQVSTTRWNDPSAIDCYVISGEHGTGADKTTYFGTLVPKWAYTLPHTASTTIPANTAHSLDVYEGETLDDAQIANRTGAVISARASYGPQRRFDVRRNAAYLAFKISFGSGYSEIDDYEFDSTTKPAGRQGG